MAAVALTALVAGCGGGDDAPADRADLREGQREAQRPEQEAAPAEPARCPPGAANCATASGTIVYVERADPDGDGDAHFVLASGESVTAPGISVIDVDVDHRPYPLPEPGDRVSAAGPVYTGSYGQRQIEADVLNVARD